MFWYIVILLVLIYLTILDSLAERRRIKITAYVFSAGAILLSFFMCCRDSAVGADTRQYVSAFAQIKEMGIEHFLFEPIYSWNGQYTYDLEFGYRIYNRILGLLFDTPTIIIFANGVLISLLSFQFIKNFSKNKMLSILAYLCLGIFQTQMNMARNAIAILICYNAAKFIKEKAFYKYCFAVLIAATFHFSSIFFLPLYWLVNGIKVDSRRLFFFGAGCALIGSSATFWLPIITMITPARYLKYLTTDSSRMVSILVMVLHIVLFMVIYMLIPRYQRSKALLDNSVGTWMFLLNVAFFSIGVTINSLARAAALFGPFLMVYFPNLIESGSDTAKRKKAITAIVTVALIMAYLGRIIVNNIGDTIPYLFLST